MTNISVRMARWSALHPWRAIIGWLVFVVLCLSAGMTAGSHQATTEDFWVGEAGRAEQLATEAGLQRKPVEHVTIRGGDGAEAAARDVAARMAKLPEVASVADPVRSRDGDTVRVSVTLKGPELEGKKNVVPLLAETEKVARAHPGLKIEETDSPAISKGVNDQRDEDLALSERISLPVTLITLLVVFGSAVMAGVPLLLALTSIAAAMGLNMLASHLIPDAGVGTNLILLIGLAVGVDYTLFYLKREREERARAGGRLTSEALVELAAATAGRSIVISGLAVIASTATLYLATDVIFSSLATGTVLVVAVAVAGSLTVLPALLVKLGRRTERRAARRARKGKAPRAERAETGRFFAALLRPARRHPAATLVAGAARRRTRRSAGPSRPGRGPPPGGPALKSRALAELHVCRISEAVPSDPLHVEARCVRTGSDLRRSPIYSSDLGLPGWHALAPNGHSLVSCGLAADWPGTPGREMHGTPAGPPRRLRR